MTSFVSSSKSQQRRAVTARGLSICVVLAAIAGSTTALRAQPAPPSQPGQPSIRIDRFEPAWTGSSSTAAAPSIVYQQAFGEGQADDRWNVRRVVNAPGGQSFLGRFGNEAVTLNLASLPEHTHLVLAFDLSIIGDWRGGTGENANTFNVSLTNGAELFLASFANINAAQLPKQSFPAQLNDPAMVLVDAATGRKAGDVHRFTRDNGSGMRDAVYRLVVEVPHTAATAGVIFKAAGLAKDTEKASWGIDNVVVVGVKGSERLGVARVMADEAAGRLDGRSSPAPALATNAEAAAAAAVRVTAEAQAGSTVAKAESAANANADAASTATIKLPPLQPVVTVATPPVQPAVVSPPPAPSPAPVPVESAAMPVESGVKPAMALTEAELLAAERARLGLPTTPPPAQQAAVQTATQTAAQTATQTATVTSTMQVPVVVTPAPGVNPADAVATAPLWNTLGYVQAIPAAYLSAFNGVPGSEWDAPMSALAPTGESFFGRLHNQQATLTLRDMPTHEQLILSTDLVLIGNWLGENAGGTPSVISIRTGSGQELLRASFANDQAGNLTLKQSYPAGLGMASNAPGTGAYRLDALRMAHAGGGTSKDSVYRLLLTLPHSLKEDTLVFAAEGLPGGTAEASWGLDNLAVLVSGASDLDATKLAASDATLRLADLGEKAGPALIAGNGGTRGPLPSTLRLGTDTFSTNFAAGQATGWSNTRMLTGPGGKMLLGPFHNEKSTLTVSGLPKHDDLVVAADILVLGNWQGNAGNASTFTITDANGKEILVTTFAQGSGSLLQSFPESGFNASNPARSGAVLVDSLGLTKPDGSPLNDSLYRVIFSIPHGQETAVLNFGASGLVGDVAGAGWGLKHLSMTARSKTDQWAGQYGSRWNSSSSTTSRTSTTSTYTRTVQHLTYASRFDVGDNAGAAWNFSKLALSPSGEAFIGPLHNESATLSLTDLPDHDSLIVDVDLYTIGQWPGDGPVPSMISVTTDDGRTIFAESFANNTGRVGTGKKSTPSTQTQSFDLNAIPGEKNKANTGAVASNTLGFPVPAAIDSVVDSTYRVRFILPHTGSNAKLTFNGSGLPGTIANAAWGIDNVGVTTSGVIGSDVGDAIASETLLSEGVYVNPFTTGPAGSEWSYNTVSFGPDGNGTLGPMGNGAAVLTLGDLPEHSHLVIATDVITTGDWPGNGPNPSNFRIVLDDGTEVFATTFATFSESNKSRTQAFPDGIGIGRYAPGTGSIDGQLGTPGFSGWSSTRSSKSSSTQVESSSSTSTSSESSSTSSSSSASSAGNWSAAGVTLVGTETVATGPSAAETQAGESAAATALPGTTINATAASGGFAIAGSQASASSSASASASASATATATATETVTTTTVETTESVAVSGSTGKPPSNIYRLYFTVPHTASAVGIKFAAENLPAGASWSLDNVAVSTVNDQNPNNAFAGGTFAGTALAGGSNGFGSFGGFAGLGSNPGTFNPFANLSYPGISGGGGDGGGGNRFFNPNGDPVIPAPAAVGGLLALAGAAGLKRRRR